MCFILWSALALFDAEVEIRLPCILAPVSCTADDELPWDQREVIPAASDVVVKKWVSMQF